MKHVVKVGLMPGLEALLAGDWRRSCGGFRWRGWVGGVRMLIIILLVVVEVMAEFEIGCRRPPPNFSTSRHLL